MMSLRAAAALSLVGTLPLIAAQGRWVRSHTPVLPEAGGPTTGTTGVGGTGPPLSVLVIGESTVAGVGAPDHAQGLTGQLAGALSARTGRPVRWRAVGKNGVTAKTTRTLLLPRVPAEPVDLIVVVLGVNDTKDLVAVPVWQRHLRALFAELRARVGPAPLLASGVPPMADFPALPVPLRQVLGLRAAAMDAALRAVVAQTPGAVWMGGFGAVGAEMFCRDRFHPGPRGYAAWGAALAEAAPV